MSKMMLSIITVAATILAGDSTAQKIKRGVVDSRKLGIASATTIGFEGCEGITDGTTPTNIGVVRIRLRKKIVIGDPTDQNKIQRAVRYKDKSFNIYSEDEDDIANEQNNKKKNPGIPDQPYSIAQPFHVYLGLKPFTNVGLVAVRVIIPLGAGYTFYDTVDQQGKPIHGVGLGAASPDKGLCGVVDINNTFTKVRQVATFYIDLAKFSSPGAPQSFNIALKPDDFPDTPIFIDPKVHNDG